MIVINYFLGIKDHRKGSIAVYLRRMTYEYKVKVVYIGVGVFSSANAH